MRGVKLHPWLQGFSAHERGLERVRGGGAAPRPDPLPRRHAAVLDPAPACDSAAAIPQTQIVLGHGGLHDLWREAIEAVLTTANVHLCMCGTPGYAMRAIVARCPIERLLFGTDAGFGPNRCSDTRFSASASSASSVSTTTTRGDPRHESAPAARRMIDVHSHVPTHRDRVPPEELVVNDKWRPDRPVAATTTWADYATAFATSRCPSRSRSPATETRSTRR